MNVVEHDVARDSPARDEITAIRVSLCRGRRHGNFDAWEWLSKGAEQMKSKTMLDVWISER